MRASLASPPRLPQRVIDASTGRRRPGLGDPRRARTGSPLLALRTFVRIGFARSAVRPITARRCSPAHRHMRASLASPPRLVSR
ncbi:hypothetical protein [Blastomonas sp. CCH8-A3]|uniref:hypothetical protein n=1 Tax=Blastomonas sp. CCH8-A3 TaxID=1768743 RepID=UPI0012E34D30|nr:hypothetical protein [Blastomonas sp. CCH8-A3]